MYLEVPKNGLGLKNATPFTIDDATEADIQDMVNLENELVGINREKDFRYFIENERRIWQTVVCRDPNKMIVGFLSSVNHPASKMIGPGVARNEEVIEIMLANLLDRFRGESPVFLLPVSATRQCSRLINWVLEIAKFILPNVGENQWNPMELSCRRSCPKPVERKCNFSIKKLWRRN